MSKLIVIILSVFFSLNAYADMSAKNKSKAWDCSGIYVTNHFLPSVENSIRLIKEAERVLNFRSFIIIEPGLTGLEKNRLMGKEELTNLQDEFGENSFSVDIGPKAAFIMLKNLGYELDEKNLVNFIKKTKSKAKEQLIKHHRMKEKSIASAKVLKSYAIEIGIPTKEWDHGFNEAVDKYYGSMFDQVKTDECHVFLEALIPNAKEQINKTIQTLYLINNNQG